MDVYEEAFSLSTSDAEPDSDFEDDVPQNRKPCRNDQKSANLDWDDPQALLDTWLGELDNIRMGLDVGGVSSAEGGGDRAIGPRPLSHPDDEKLQLHEPRIDTYRFSMANLEDSQDGELDAILKELNALGSQFDKELTDKLSPTSQVARTPSSPDSMFSKRLQHSMMIGSSGVKPKLDIATMSNFSESVDPVHRIDSGLRTESPDNDSAFSDSISMLSSESSASSGASAARTEASKASGTSGTSSAFASISSSSSSTSGPVPDAAARLKAEKIRLALEKMREANVKKLFIKAFTSDGSTKSLLVDEKMTVGHVIRLLADKNHVRMEPKWSLIEHCADLYMERIYEDHELLVDQLMLWTRDSRNKLFFLERPEKYALFSRPEEFLLLGTSSEKDQSHDDDSRSSLLEEFFSSTGVGVPEIEGPLYLKAEGKKAWKRYFFVLRASGLYYSPKGKSRSLKDLVCLATFDVNQVYSAWNWRKKFKAPTDFGFAIKHPKLQSKSTKFIKYLCADDERSYRRWMMGIRIAKTGKRLQDNYKALVDELAQEDLDQLANARSFSLASVTTSPTAGDIPECLDESSGSTPVNTLDRNAAANLRRSHGSLSASSGCPSEPSGCSTPTLESGFECDFPTGTIKRKPSMTPKIPLTSTTRLLVKEVGDKVDGDITDSGNVSRNTQRQSFRKSLTEEVNNVRRKGSLSPCTTEPVAGRIPAVIQKEAVDELPLPPPPPEVAVDEISGPESLPPPPPEAFESKPGDDSPSGSAQYVSRTLPLPPPALRSKTPSPTPVTLKPCLKPSSSSSAPKVPPKPTVGCFPRRESGEHNIYANTESKSPIKKTRRITFDDSPPAHVVTKPPPPPRRVDTLRASSKETSPLPQRLDSPGCAVTPPKEFLKDLQRVMQKKWQVAQKCKVESELTSHEVLGFRDAPPPPPQPSNALLMTMYRENNVRAWVAEHYGSTEGTSHPDRVGLAYFESVFVPSGKRDACPSSPEAGREFMHPYLPQQQPNLSSRLSTASASSGSSSNKRLPPPPPKRSDTTHLSTRIH